MNLNVNYGLWVIEGSLVVTNVCAMWCKMLIVERLCMCLGKGHMGNPVLSSRFCCEPKTALKNKI